MSLRIIIAASILWFSAGAQASIIWTFQEAVFTDGGTVTGFFAFDAVTKEVLDFDIAVSGGEVDDFPEITYDPETAEAIPGLMKEFKFITEVTLPNGRTAFNSITIESLAALSKAGGIVELDAPASGESSQEQDCEGADCENSRGLVSGALSSEVPIPTTFALLGLGLLALARGRRTS